ncbi:MAG TPA: hypothetical protein VGN16_15695 [Acidobacteriaceae bacterium]|jgi:hypothetical protein
MTSFNHPGTQPVHDAVPNPEPAVPSLPGPDPGVFHHDPGTPVEPSHESPTESEGQ